MARKRATSLEVAREAGVSRTTVSFVLNNIAGAGIPEDTRRRVLEAAARLNYHPNVTGRRLVSGRTFTLGFVMHQSPERAAADLFVPQVLHGLDACVRRQGYHVLFRPVDPDNPQDGYAYLVLESYVDGIVLSGPQLVESEAVDLFRQRQPVVVTGRLPDADVPSVDADNYQGAQLATRHLIGLGHRRIGLITNAPRSYLASRERFLGYRDALRDASLPADEDLVGEAHYTSQSGYRTMNGLLDLAAPPTAVFVASDVVAFGAIQAIKERGQRIPEDIAIVGFDDVAMARFVEPHLTTVRLPAYELGWRAGQLFLQLVDQQTPAELHQLLPAELIVRDSCGAGARPNHTARPRAREVMADKVQTDN